MKKILKLDNKTIENIAAGEIINRPSSIIKELVENSIDAGANSIVVEIKSGGKDYIRVTDDGDGIFKEDLPNVFKKHYTSKIADFKDIYDLSTRGFRGEALNSIQNVSDVVLTTKTREENVGYSILYSFGEYISTKESVTNYGTTIESKNLFKNMPVRRKFLQSDRVEENHIKSLLESFAIGYLDISFKLICNGRMCLNTSGSGDIKNALLEVFDLETATNTIEINNSLDNYYLTGVIGNNTNSTISKNKGKFYVNGRITESSSLDKLINNIYYGIIPRNRKPVYFLYLDIPKSDVDVNIHPSKKYVSFKDYNKVEDLVKSSIENALTNYSNLSISSMNSTSTIDEEPIYFDDSDLLKEKSFNENNDKDELCSFNIDNVAEESDDYELDINYNNEISSNSDNIENISTEESCINKDYQIEIPNLVLNTSTNINTEEFDIKKLLPLDGIWNFNRPLGMLFNKYYLIENRPNDILIIVDIKNCNERTLYDNILKEYKNSEINTQIVIEPYIYYLDSDAREYVRNNLDLFNNLGFDIDFIADNSLILRGVPSFLSQTFKKNDFDDLLYNLADGNNHKKVTDLYLIKLLSHIASTASKFMNDTDFYNTLKSTLQSDNPLVSPQGKNIFTVINKEEFEGKILNG